MRLPAAFRSAASQKFVDQPPQDAAASCTRSSPHSCAATKPARSSMPATPSIRNRQQRLGWSLGDCCGSGAGNRVIGSSGEVKRHSAFGTRHSAQQNQFNTKASKTPPLFTSPDDPITRSPGSPAGAGFAAAGVGSPDPLSQALKSTDLLLQAGGFGVVVLDLADVPISAARRIPLTTWFRFRRAVENTSTAFIVIEQTPHAKSCATLVMDLTAQQASWSEASGQNGTVMSAHAGNPAPLFRVTAEGIAIPFEQSATSSFAMPQRWSMPHARLLNTVHVHLQITRSRSAMQPPKLPAKPAFEFENALIHHRDTEAQSSRLSFQTAACGEELLQTPVA